MTSKLFCALPLSLLMLCAGCGGNDPSGDTYNVTLTAGSLTDGNDSLSETDSSPGDGDGDPGGDGDPSGDGDTGPKLDVIGNDEGMPTAGDAGDGDGCQKVDFLFVIDNSGSMLEEQDNLAASFPSFINSISSTLDAAQDYHIMVIDTDAWVYAGCPFLCGFPLPGVCVGYECGVTQPAQCEDVLGAGVTWPKGANSSNANCNFVNGKRFMTDAEPNLPGAFQCAARVGTDSTDDPERPMEAMAAAVSGQGLAGNCNYDFLRDDAILVVTYITDEDDNAGDGSSGGVDTWRQALIDAKNGDESAIVVLGLFGDDDLPNAQCNGGAETSPRLRSFLDSWGDKGIFGSICAPDYDDFFQTAVDIIDTTCDEFVPPE
ncbi:hypothetical protein DB30_04472 [Enhygromyxa salina]|uniref:VWFA domain-containing protein n=1 Tax=Enhygromyxa salina TaxID=215803 RepID=A0A0C1ZYW0_9BACT|nr:hypothetical protein [Enhygromyxa salina]KIG16428.1 hypothetical protein DB30_04472 [Enhygromyxa salina]